MTRHLSRIATLAAASALLAGALPLASASAATTKHHPKPPPVPTEPTSGACRFAPLEDQTYSTFIGLPHDPKRTPSRGESTVVLDTNQGDIPTTPASEMPCSVASSPTWKARCPPVPPAQAAVTVAPGGMTEARAAMTAPARSARPATLIRCSGAAPSRPSQTACRPRLRPSRKGAARSKQGSQTI